MVAGIVFGGGQGTKALRAWNILGAVAGRSLPCGLCGVRSGAWPSGELATAVVKTKARLPRLGAQSLALSGSFHLPSVQWCSVDVGPWRPGLDGEAGGLPGGGAAHVFDVQTGGEVILVGAWEQVSLAPVAACLPPLVPAVPGGVSGGCPPGLRSVTGRR